jgi:hypothetical protein
MDEVFSADWEKVYASIARMVQDPTEVLCIKDIFKEKFLVFREMYRYYASQSPSAFTVSQLAFTEICKNCHINDHHVCTEIAIGKVFKGFVILF